MPTGRRSRPRTMPTRPTLSALTRRGVRAQEPPLLPDMSICASMSNHRGLHNPIGYSQGTRTLRCQRIHLGNMFLIVLSQSSRTLRTWSLIGALPLLQNLTLTCNLRLRQGTREIQRRKPIAPTQRTAHQSRQLVRSQRIPITLLHRQVTAAGVLSEPPTIMKAVLCESRICHGWVP